MVESTLSTSQYTLGSENGTIHSFSTNTTDFELSGQLNEQERLYLLVYHCAMFIIGTIGNALLFICTLRFKQQPNTLGETVSALLGRDKESNFRINRVVILENLSFNGLMICLTVIAPVVTTHTVKYWALGHVMCKLIAQSTEILYTSGLLVYFTMSLHRLGVVVCPYANVKPTEVKFFPELFYT